MQTLLGLIVVVAVGLAIALMCDRGTILFWRRQSVERLGKLARDLLVGRLETLEIDEFGKAMLSGSTSPTVPAATSSMESLGTVASASPPAKSPHCDAAPSRGKARVRHRRWLVSVALAAAALLPVLRKPSALEQQTKEKKPPSVAKRSAVSEGSADPAAKVVQDQAPRMADKLQRLPAVVPAEPGLTYPFSPAGTRPNSPVSSPSQAVNRASSAPSASRVRVESAPSSGETGDADIDGDGDWIQLRIVWPELHEMPAALTSLGAQLFAIKGTDVIGQVELLPDGTEIRRVRIDMDTIPEGYRLISASHFKLALECDWVAVFLPRHQVEKFARFKVEQIRRAGGHSHVKTIRARLERTPEGWQPALVTVELKRHH